MAQQRRVEERRKKEFRKKLSKILVIGIPSLAVLALVIVLIVDGVTNNSGENQSNSTDTEASSETSGSSGSSDTNSQDTGSSYSTDSSLTVEDGDTVNIDYVGSVDGVEFDGGNTQGMGTDLVIGSGSYIDDFEDQLIGAHPGDQVDVYVTFPEDYGVEELNGKDVEFTVTVNSISTLVYPELTDDIVKEISDCETVDEYITYANDQVKLNNEQQANDKKETEIWKKIVETQDIGEMDSCFEKIPIKKGDVIYIPGGMPHAIGEGVFMLEMMEPSDLVVRCEFSREGIIVPPEARFMGKGIDFCMNIFDYTYHSKEDILRNFFLTPEPIHKESSVLIERLIPGSISGCFETERITIHNGHSEINLDNRYAVLLCTKGNGTVESGYYAYPVSILDSFFIAANTQKISVTTTEEIELCLIKPTH